MFTNRPAKNNRPVSPTEFNPLTEARVIYELAQHDVTTATDLCKELGLDAGYLSRILRGFKKRGLIEAQLSDTDRRLSLLKLTASGQQAFAFLDSHSQNEIEALLSRMQAEDRNRLLAAMQTIQRLIGSDRSLAASNCPSEFRTKTTSCGW